MIAARSGGFLYCVSLVGVTGARASLPSTVGRLIRDVRAVSPVPVAVGFGVSRPAHVRAIARAGADGVIVASALVDALGPDGRDVDADGRASSAAWPEATRSMSRRIAVAIERPAPSKAFATAVDWPGWSRSGKTPEARARGARRVRRPGTRPSRPWPARRFPPMPGASRTFEIVERDPGGGGTDFGVPSRVTDARPPADDGRPRRIGCAGWSRPPGTVFDRVAATAPAELRKGPRGGGRDRDKVVDHVIEADHAYARRDRDPGLQAPSRDDRAADRGDARGDARRPRPAVRRLAPRRTASGPPRYAAGRIAWHALDHAWEMEDRSEPG